MVPELIFSKQDLSKLKRIWRMFHKTTVSSGTWETTDISVLLGSAKLLYTATFCTLWVFPGEQGMLP